MNGYRIERMFFLFFRSVSLLSRERKATLEDDAEETGLSALGKSQCDRIDPRPASPRHPRADVRMGRRRQSAKTVLLFDWSEV